MDAEPRPSSRFELDKKCSLQFRFHEFHVDEIVTMSASGELDVANATVFRDQLMASILKCSTGRVFVDMAEVTFIDAAVLSALVYCREGARRRSREIVLTNPSRVVRRALDLTRLTSSFAIIDGAN